MNKHIDKTGLKKEDATDRIKWRNGAYELSRDMRCIWPSLLTDKTGYKIVDISLYSVKTTLYSGYLN